MKEFDKPLLAIPVNKLPQVLAEYKRLMNELTNAIEPEEWKEESEEMIDEFQEPFPDRLSPAREILDQYLQYIKCKIDDNYNPVLKMDDVANRSSLNNILSIVLVRISTLIARFLDQSEPLDSANVFLLYRSLINWARNLQESVLTQNLLRQSYLYNITNSIINNQTDPFSSKIPEYLVSRPRIFTFLSQDEVKIAREAQNLFKDGILRSKLFNTALAKLAKQYNLEDSFDLIIACFKEINIVWVINAKFWSMVGFNHTIFLNYDIFTSPLFKTEIQQKAKIIQTIIHQGLNLAFRKLSNNFLNYTLPVNSPTNKSNINSLQGGYILEELTWGKHNIAFYHPKYVDRVVKAESWDKEEPLFSDIISSGDSIHCRGISKAYDSGLELMEQDFVWEI